MPLKCKSKVRYRFKKGTKIRFAFCGNKVIEVKKFNPKLF
jgi:hypothetical protein